MNHFIIIEKNDIVSYESNDTQSPVLCVRKSLSGFQQILHYYNEHGDIFLEQVLGLEEELLYEMKYQYCYDEYGNKISKTKVYHGYDTDYQRDCDPVVQEYLNVLDASSRLIEVTCKNQEDYIRDRKFFEYENDLITRIRLHDGKSDISFIYENTYDQDSILVCTKVSSSDAKILYWMNYEYLGQSVYRCCKTSPTGSKACWWIQGYQSDDISIIVQESVLTVELLNEILNYTLKQFGFVSDIILDVQECDIRKCSDEIEEAIEQFTSCNHIEVSFDF